MPSSEGTFRNILYFATSVHTDSYCANIRDDDNQPGTSGLVFYLNKSIFYCRQAHLKAIGLINWCHDLIRFKWNTDLFPLKATTTMVASKRMATRICWVFREVLSLCNVYIHYIHVSVWVAVYVWDCVPWRSSLSQCDHYLFPMSLAREWYVVQPFKIHSIRRYNIWGALRKEERSSIVIIFVVVIVVSEWLPFVVFVIAGKTAGVFASQQKHSEGKRAIAL